ncbi:hypothetical protein HanXRQr2_Chr04g0184231 [Helianthus annuus]|uniref:Uncharacterized protein n=2 Tax=Helianthus annuus TaxID=4232 RepID=A0A9K3JAX4_HELAN|nr:hypothetical protein HanXRQr2_Chr04g0184231 [Helianthus annuus]KAJ0932788.1 hypothetical protein HanPSC8_Chr04g0177681 [Helianthus annuus]
MYITQLMRMQSDQDKLINSLTKVYAQAIAICKGNRLRDTSITRERNHRQSERGEPTNRVIDFNLAGEGNMQTNRLRKICNSRS